MAPSVSTAPIILPSHPKLVEDTPNNKYQYLYFDVTSGFFNAVTANRCECGAIAAKVLIFALPVIFILEALFDLAAFPLFWAANQICHETDEMPPPVKLNSTIRQALKFESPRPPRRRTVSVSGVESSSIGRKKCATTASPRTPLPRRVPARRAPLSRPKSRSTTDHSLPSVTASIPTPPLPPAPIEVDSVPLPQEQRFLPPTHYETFRAAIGFPLEAVNPPPPVPAPSPPAEAGEGPTPAIGAAQQTIVRFYKNMAQLKDGAYSLYSSYTTAIEKEEGS